MLTAVKKKKLCPEVTHCPAATVSVRLISILIALQLAPAVATAETGDRVYINYPVVNLRDGPDITSPIVLKLNKGQALIEVERQDDWVLVATGRSDVKSGWVYANLIGPAGDDKKSAATVKVEKPAATAEVKKKLPPAKPDPDGPLFNLFRQAFAELNTRLKAETGKDCFSMVGNPGHGVVQVTITDDWPDLSHEQRQQTLTDIFAIWDAAVGVKMPITVDIIDKDGIRLMSKFR